MRGSSARAVRPTSSASTATRSPIPTRCGASGAPPTPWPARREAKGAGQRCYAARYRLPTRRAIGGLSMRPALLRAAFIGAIVSLAVANPVGAIELNGGCTIEVVSTDATGAVVDTASGPGDAGGGTQADPFLIDWDGSVAWEGSSGDQVFNNHTWQT